MPYTREMWAAANGPIHMELEGNALDFRVVMQERDGVLVELSTHGDASSEEAKLIEAATLGSTSKGCELTIPVPNAVTIMSSNRRGTFYSGDVSYGTTVVGNVTQYGYGNTQYNLSGGNVSFGGRGGNVLTLRHGVAVTVYLPQNSDVLIERGSGLRVIGRAGCIETDLAGADVIFDEAYELHVRTSRGDVKGQFVARTARVKTSGGDIRIGEILGEVDLGTSGGDIKVKEAHGSGRMQTSGGNLKLGSFYGSEMTMRTSGGDISHPDHRGISANTSGGSINGKSRW